MPSPVQSGQAPWGELNENERGSSSSMRGPVIGTAVLLAVALFLERARVDRRDSITPSPRRSAVSTESANRRRPDPGCPVP